MKTVKSCIWMAAATMMAATLGACSNDDLTAIETPIQKGNVVTLTATLSPKDRATTRALTDPGDGTLTSAWAVGEELEVMYEDTHGETPSARGKITAVDGSGKATVTVDLVDPQTGTAYFHYPYNRTTGLKDTKIDQIGALNDLGANFDEFEGNGTITVTDDVPSLPDDVTLTRNVCVWKLKFTDAGNDITSDIISLSINDGTREYLITPSSLSAIYVAMYGCTGASITIKAATATGVYSASKAGVTLQAGKSYHSTVALTATAASDTYRVFTSKTDYTDEVIPGGATTVTSGTTTWTDGTYVVSGNVTITDNVTVSASTAVNLILKDGASLTVNGTITGGNTLNIYGQELSTGKLDVIDNNINVSVENITIHGGIITVTEGGVMQGIETVNDFTIYHGKVTTAGGANGFMMMGDMHIYGGDITATSTNGQALLVSGSNGKDGSFTMTGGTFRAIGTGTGSYNKGIMVTDGNGKGTASITISGGTVIATGGNSDGSDTGSSGIEVCGNLTISGGAIVTVNGGQDNSGSDVGGGYGINVRKGSTSGGDAIINGGTVNTNGGLYMAGISVYTLTINSGEVTTTAASSGGEGILANTEGTYPDLTLGSITVNGGLLIATGGDNTCGIGGRITTVTGGKVYANGGENGVGIETGIVLTGVTMYEGDSPNPSTSAADQSACTKRYVKIQ